MATTRSTVRKNVPLDQDDLRDLTAIKETGSDKAAALYSITGIKLSEKPSEAEVLHALVVLGRQVVADKEVEIGYQKLARFMEDDSEAKAWRTSRRARTARRHIQERGAA